MKTSKMDQIRALREGSVDAARAAGIDVQALAVAMLQEGRVDLAPAAESLRDKLPILKAAKRLGTAPLLAREGKCASCDRRRALLKAAKARHRALLNAADVVVRAFADDEARRRAKKP